MLGETNRAAEQQPDHRRSSNRRRIDCSGPDSSARSDTTTSAPAPAISSAPPLRTDCTARSAKAAAL